jgi:regulator of protease activity HflC (stomatin/prohibitin superfamily)
LFLLIGGILIALVALIAAAATRQAIVAVIGVIVGIVMIVFSTFYTQEVGEAMVIKNADGTIATTDIDAGLGTKAPWQDTISFDIKGQQALFKADGKSTQQGEEVDGPEITVAGTDKVPVNVDIAIRYSLGADKVDDIYTEYKTEDVLKQRLIIQDIKSIVKDSASAMNVDSLIADRAGFSKKIDENLKARWAGKGVIVDSVALQTVRPPQSILDRINASQVAQQQLVQAQADTKVKEEQARQLSIEAKGVADANRIKNESLTDKILQDKYIDALANSKSLVVVPNGSTPMVQVPQDAGK